MSQKHGLPFAHFMLDGHDYHIKDIGKSTHGKVFYLYEQLKDGNEVSIAVAVPDESTAGGVYEQIDAIKNLCDKLFTFHYIQKAVNKPLN